MYFSSTVIGNCWCSNVELSPSPKLAELKIRVLKCELFQEHHPSGQIIATSRDLKWWFSKGIFWFPGNLGWWNIIIWPDPFSHPFLLRKFWEKMLGKIGGSTDVFWCRDSWPARRRVSRRDSHWRRLGQPWWILWDLWIQWKEVQRLFFEWFFRKDYCFSMDLQSTIQGDYSFYGLWLPGNR